MALGVPFTRLPKFNSPDSIKIVVAGAEAGKFSSFIPSFGVGMAHMPTAYMSHPVTLPVEPRPATLDRPQVAAANGVNLAAVVDPVTKAPKGTLLAERNRTLLQPVALVDISKVRGSEILDNFEARLK